MQRAARAQSIPLADTPPTWAGLAATVVTVVGGVLLVSEQNHKRRERKKTRSVQ